MLSKDLQFHVKEVNTIFGYLKPYKGELKLKEISEYRDAYCTVCYGMRKYTGSFSTLFLNYESVFLYLVLSGTLDNEVCQEMKFRCQTNPLKKVKAVANVELLEYTSFVSYTLILLKLLDNCRDAKRTRRFISKTLYAVMSKNKSFLRLKQENASVYDKLIDQYDELYRLENSDSAKFDECLATMGGVLFEIVSYYTTKCDLQNEDLCEFSKHLGMWIYLMDAYDDYDEDDKNQTFNPLYLFRKTINCESGNFDARGRILAYAEMMLLMMIENMKEKISNVNLGGNQVLVDNIIDYSMRNEIKRIKSARIRKERGANLKKKGKCENG